MKDKKYDSTKKVTVMKPSPADMKHKEKPMNLSKMTQNFRLTKKVGG